MRATSERGWLALSCDRDGQVEQILRDDLALAKVGASLIELVDSGSMQKAQTFLTSVLARESVAGWDLNVASEDGARSMSFAGAVAEESLLILAAPSAAAVAALFDDLAASNAALSEALHALLHDQGRGRDYHLYEELSRLNNELINRERELARKSAALERVSAEKSRMVAIAAHDLRNPLTVITTYADLLKLDESLDADGRLYADEIARSARFMTELVEEMLESSHLESGQVELDVHDIDLVATAASAAVVNEVRASRKAITIAFEAQVERLFIRADALKLRQILNNLLVNAIKFSPSHTTVIVRVRRTDDHAIVEVQDHGIGIPREKLTTIFEPFRTLAKTGTAGERSTGLGLSIVKQLAELHRAKVEVESEEGRGSLFRLCFPINR